MTTDEFNPGDVLYGLGDWTSLPKLTSATVKSASDKQVRFVASASCTSHRVQVDPQWVRKHMSATPRGAWLKWGAWLQDNIDRHEAKISELRKSQNMARAKADEALEAQQPNAQADPATEPQR